MKTYFEKRNKFQCPKCRHTFEMTNIWSWLARPHIFDVWRRIKCPNCGKTTWMRKVDK